MSIIKTSAKPVVTLSAQDQTAVTKLAVAAVTGADQYATKTAGIVSGLVALCQETGTAKAVQDAFYAAVTVAAEKLPEDVRKNRKAAARMAWMRCAKEMGLATIPRGVKESKAGAESKEPGKVETSAPSMHETAQAAFALVRNIADICLKPSDAKAFDKIMAQIAEYEEKRNVA